MSYDNYIGKTDSHSDVLTASMVKRYRAVIGADKSGDTAPNGIHWCTCLPNASMVELGPDGHPAIGGFLPTNDLPRRMWASSEIEFLSPIKIGAQIKRISTVASVKEKIGRSGKLLFVNVDHVKRADGKDAIHETQTIVYRAAPSVKSELPVAQDIDLSGWEVTESTTPSTALLFRYSALTFNTHRIHYDYPYTTELEGYPALVVHGPLMASLLLRFAGNIVGEKNIAKFGFRGLSPAYCNQALTLAANKVQDGLDLAIIGVDGKQVMSAQVELR